MLADLRGASDNISADNFRALRLWKGREMLRIALREIAEVAALEETTAELSQLAEICVSEVLQHWHRELSSRLGAPDAAFTVLGLGKLGGRELNHSSDIDVLFFYSEEGQLSATLTYHQWFNRLAAKISETFAFAGPSGSLFRMDLAPPPGRFRWPDGAVAREPGKLLLRLRRNLGAARPDQGATRRRRRRIELRFPPRSISRSSIRRARPPELLDEIAAIKRRIERDIVGHEHLERNVKLGTGGIREIEFVVQALQLLARRAARVSAGNEHAEGAAGPR